MKMNTQQHMGHTWDTAMAVQNKFIALQAYLKKKKKNQHQMNNLTLHLKQQEKTTTTNKTQSK